MSVIHGRVPISDFDAPPAFQWSEHHKQIGSAVALVFIIVAPGLSRLHPDWGTSFLYKLLGGLVHANQGMIGIVGPLIDFQHIFHRRYECTVRLGRNNPLLLDVGFENVFLELVRSCYCWPCQQSSAPQPPLPAAATSSGHVPWEVRSRPEQ